MTTAITQQQTEDTLQTPRLTKDYIDSLLNKVEVYTTTAQLPIPHVIAIAWLDGKFHLGTAISKADIATGYFNEELGIERSTDDVLKLAENKLWELEGYKLYSSLNNV